MTQRDEKGGAASDAEASSERPARAESNDTMDAAALASLVADLRRRLDIAEGRMLQLAAEARGFEALAHEDELTGIANLRRFNQWVREFDAAGPGAGGTLCAAFIDVDHFKWVNDTFKHEVGDEVLKAIASIATEHVREVDLAARLHGDEFAILFRDVDEASARSVCERIRAAVRAHDWDAVAKGLAVGISIGVVQAVPGDTRKSLMARSDQAMYDDKERRRGEVERTYLSAGISPVILQRIALWMERAERVVVFVGSTHAADLAADADVDESTIADWKRFTHADSLQAEPAAFDRFWATQKARLASSQPSPVHRLLVEWAAQMPSTTFVTERVDGVLAKAGALHVIELYGNLFRTRCQACGHVTGVAGLRLCPDCGGMKSVPDICLVGQSVNARLLGQAELAAKGADLVLVLDCDLSLYPGASLLEKARVRGARVVMFGSTHAPHSTGADVATDAPPALVLRDLLLRSKTGASAAVLRQGLSDDGFAALCFLSGHGTDHQGRTLEQMLHWTDRQIERTSTATQWQFPLLTRSRICPEAPVPTEADFTLLARDDKVRAGVRRGFERMLAHWGFEWSDGRVRRSAGWQAGFERWQQLGSIHSLRISRVLGALSLCGLQAEADAFLTTLEHEMPRVSTGASGPLRYWRGAVRQHVL